MTNKRLCVILSMLWLVLIFCLAGNNTVSSYRNTYNMINTVINKYNSRNISTTSDISDKKSTSMERKRIEAINFTVRKSAHFTEYLVLSLLIASTMFAFNDNGKGTIVHILFVCLLAAVFDEFIQIFVGRHSSVGDVLIDFSGSCVGATLYYVYYKIRKRGKSPA